MTNEDLEKTMEIRAAAEVALETATGTDVAAYQGVINECNALITNHYVETMEKAPRIDPHAFDGYKRAKGIKL